VYHRESPWAKWANTYKIPLAIKNNSMCAYIFATMLATRGNSGRMLD
ncbi:unnamed protein product, partial [Acidithrix sp. C25]